MYEIKFPIDDICRELRVSRNDSKAPIKREIAKELEISVSALTKRVNDPSIFKLGELVKLRAFLTKNGIDKSIDDLFLRKRKIFFARKIRKSKI